MDTHKNLKANDNQLADEYYDLRKQGFRARTAREPSMVTLENDEGRERRMEQVVVPGSLRGRAAFR